MRIDSMKPYWSRGGIDIYHADCHDVLPLIVESSVDLVLTDPPYGHRQNDGDLAQHWERALGRQHAEYGEARAIAGDGPEANDNVRFAFAESKRILKPGACCCCCCGGGGGPDPQFARWSLWLDEAMEFKHAVVWDKGGLGMGWHYRRNYELVLIGQKPGAACKWNGGREQGNVVRICGIKPRAWDHPTPKPVELMALFIRLHTDPGDLVVDPFMGAGSTLEAAKLQGRRAIGIELEERWCELAVRRLEQEVFDFIKGGKCL